jgi:hypothetical protein
MVIVSVKCECYESVVVVSEVYIVFVVMIVIVSG